MKRFIFVILLNLMTSLVLVLTGCAHPDSIQSTIDAEIKVCKDYEAGKISAEEGLRLQRKIRNEAILKYGNNPRAAHKYSAFRELYDESDCLKSYRRRMQTKSWID